MNENKPAILVVDDDQNIRRLLRISLATRAHSVIEAATGEEAVSKAKADKPDIVILDLGLPDMDGVDVIRLLRQWTQIPIIILSVRGADKDKIDALDAGADDYLTKPFSTGELSARIRVALRRVGQLQIEPIFVSGDLRVDLEKRLVTVENREVQLTPKEYDLLRLLVIHAGKVLTHHYLLREIWGETYEQEFRILYVNICNLRRKIEIVPELPQHIITEPGIGYRLKVS
jgi:two-component system, OmpR family, KDP operon response regulator KdpE